MKFIYFLLLITPLFAISQKEQSVKSKLETFGEKSGTLIQKTYIDVGKVNSLVVQILTIENLTDNTKISGLVFEASVYSSLGSDTKRCFLDADEVEGLIKSLTYFKDKIFPTSPANYTETGFTSRTGFEATAFQDNKKKWSIALKLEKYDSRSSVYFKDGDLNELIAVIEKAKSQL
jgi:hypothetical protein